MIRYLLCTLTAIFLFFQGIRSEKVLYGRSDGISSPVVVGAVQDDNGIMWFATWNGLYAYDGYEFHRVSILPGEKSSIHSNLFRNIIKLPSGNILCRTDNGFYEFDSKTMFFHDFKDSLPGSLLRQLYGVWHGTDIVQGDAVVRWTGSAQGIVKEFTSLCPSYVMSGSDSLTPRTVMVDSRGRLWVGSQAHPQIQVYEKDSVVDSMSVGFTPYSIFESSSGKIFIGGKPAGLVRNDGKFISNDVVYDMVEDGYGRLWIATWGGGLKFLEDPESENPEVRSLGAGNKIRKLLLTGGGNLVAASSEGLVTVRLDSLAVNAVCRIPGNVESLCSDATMGIVQDSKGYIYVATENSGISRVSEESLFSGNPVFKHYNVANSLLDADEIYGIGIENDTTIIIAGSDRMMVLNPEKGICDSYCRPFWGNEVTFAEGNPARLSDGTWVFATSKGVLAASPGSFRPLGYVPALTVTALSINGSSEQLMFLPDGYLGLDSSNRNVSIHFVAIDYVDNDHILYRYRVDGSPWSAYSLSRSLTLFNLSAGKHQVELQSSDRYGRRINNTKTITLYVEPFWYETWWALILFIIAGVATAGALMWLIIYIRNVKRKHRELLSKYMEMLEKSTSIEMSEIKRSFDDNVVEAVVESVEDGAFLKRVHKYIENNISNPDANYYCPLNHKESSPTS